MGWGQRPRPEASSCPFSSPPRQLRASESRAGRDQGPSRGAGVSPLSFAGSHLLEDPGGRGFPMSPTPTHKGTDQRIREQETE